jgi:hypothetical protein
MVTFLKSYYSGAAVRLSEQIESNLSTIRIIQALMTSTSFRIFFAIMGEMAKNGKVEL